MNLLRRLGLVRSLDGLSHFGRRPSNGLLRPVDLVPSSPAAATSKDWVMLNSLVRPMDDTIAVDARTVAETRTTTGCHLRVAMGIATTPACSFLYYDLLDCGPRYKACTRDPTVIATQGDSVLFEMNHVVAGSNYLVYTTGAAATTPPSLSLVPAYIIRTGWQLRKVSLLPENTGILRRGQEELIVAQLEGSTDGLPQNRANIWVLHVGERKWKLKAAVPLVADTGGTTTRQAAPWQGSESHKVVGVGGRFLCWVHYRNGILVCDMLEEHPKLWYMPMPVVPPPWKDYYEDDNRPPIEVSRNVFGTDDDGVLRFVSIDLRCCCGGFGMSTCEHSRSAFMLTTWSLVLSTKEPMVWMKNTVLHCEELWALPGYEDLPRVHPECPIMSLHNPDVVCFRVSGDDVTWMVEVDTRSRKLLSALRCTTNAQERNSHFPVEVAAYTL